jgi:cysteinyl-tRNA synthetase
MTIRIQDTLTREKRELVPLEPGLVRLYVCGPTDTVARWLIARGYRVRFVNNITDIDDKIIQRAHRTGEDWRAITARYTQQYFDHLRALGVVTITDHPRCTEFVPQMIRFVEELLAAGRAYAAPDGIYYEVARQPAYGKLSGRRVEDMIAGSRVEASEGLRHPADFALWKAAKPGEPVWDSPFGPGRPGWHLECSVMSSELLGGAFDLHGGGDDLKFPHHENEIAQSEAHGDAYASCWMHHGLVQFGGKKVAKSDPRMKDPAFSRQFQASWLLATHGAPALRFFLLRGHYRRPIDFEPGNLEAARTGLVRLLRQLGSIGDEERVTTLPEILAQDLHAELASHRARFCAAMDDDFNSGEAIAELFAIAHDANVAQGEARAQALRLLRDLGRLLGLFQPGDLARLDATRQGDERTTRVVEGLLAVRAAARERKDFASSDAVRDLLAQTGVVVKDGPTGASFEGSRGDGLPALLDAILALRVAARARRDFALADALRDVITGAGIKLLDTPTGSRWEL